MKRICAYGLSLFAITAFLLATPGVDQVFAHRSGCHRWHSCPSDSGSYTCGDTGYTSGCGSYTLPSYSYTPVKTVRDTTREEGVDYRTITKYDFREYPGYMKIKQTGSTGVRTITTTISLTDGVETSRADTSNSVTTTPVDQIVIMGGRTKPVAKIYGIANSSPGFLGVNKGKYDVWGKYKANSKIYLFVNKAEMSNSQTNSNGWFVFRNVAIKRVESWLLVFERSGNKVITLSEKTKVSTKTKKVTTEYDILHP